MPQAARLVPRNIFTSFVLLNTASYKFDLTGKFLESTTKIAHVAVPSAGIGIERCAPPPVVVEGTEEPTLTFLVCPSPFQVWLDDSELLL